MEERVKDLERKVDTLKDRTNDQDVRLARMDVRLEAMHTDFNRVVGKLDDIHRSIQPLAEWASKSKGGLAMLGALIGLLFVIVGAFATQVFSRLFN